MYGQAIAKLHQALTTLELQILTLESATGNLELFRALRAGASAFERAHGQPPSDNVDDIMDETSEISEVTPNPVAGVIEEDDVCCVHGADEVVELTLRASCGRMNCLLSWRSCSKSRLRTALWAKHHVVSESPW